MAKKLDKTISVWKIQELTENLSREEKLSLMWFLNNSLEISKESNPLAADFCSFISQLHTQEILKRREGK